MERELHFKDHDVIKFCKNLCQITCTRYLCNLFVSNIDHLKFKKINRVTLIRGGGRVKLEPSLPNPGHFLGQILSKSTPKPFFFLRLSRNDLLLLKGCLKSEKSKNGQISPLENDL